MQEEEITRVGVSIETSADDQTKQYHHAPETDSGSCSENGEKPVREKLKKTDLEEATHPSTRVEVVQEEEVGEQVGHGKLNKKRSFEDLEEKDEAGEPSTPSSGVHARKRSRDARSRHTKKSSSLKHSDTVPEDEEEDLEHSGDESDKLQDTPQSSGDESMGSANGVLEEKSSAHKFDVSEPASSRSKLPALDEMDERKSSPDSTERNNQEPLVVGIQTEGQGIKEVSNSITKEEPKVTRKRSRELMAEGEDGTDEMQDNNKVPATEKTKARRSSSPPNVLEPLTESKTAKDEVKSIKTVDSGGFANNSAVSPFASLSPRKSPSNTTPHDLPQTSASAFAASGFASMSGSTSPFGALGSSSTGSKSPPPSEPTQASSSAFAASGFASMTGNASAFGAIGTKSTGSASPFAAATPQSGFGSFGGKPLGSGLGSGFGGGSKLSSFAAPVGDAKLDKSKEAKPFGAPASDSESDSNEDDSGSDSKATDSKTEDEPVGETKVFGESSTDIAKDRKFKIRNGMLDPIHKFLSLSGAYGFNKLTFTLQPKSRAKKVRRWHFRATQNCINSSTDNG